MQATNLFLLIGVLLAIALIGYGIRSNAKQKKYVNAYTAHVTRRKEAKIGTRFSWTFFSTLEAKVAILAFFSTLLITGMLQLPLWFSFILIVLSAPLAWYFTLSYKRAKMRAEFSDRFPESIDAFTRAVQAGIPLNNVIESLADIFPGELGTRYRLLVQQLELGISMREALSNFSKDLELSEVDFFCAVLSLHRETGSSLVPMLESLGSILRENKAIDRKLKALTAEARGAATVLCILPIFVIGLQFFLNPSQMALLLSDPSGKTILGYCVTSMLVGFFVIQRMSRMME